jgi:hypothetical protein
METFVGRKIINNKTNDTVYIHQPELLIHLKQEFGGLVESLKEFSTPASPRTTVKHPDKKGHTYPCGSTNKVQIRSRDVIIFGKAYKI